MALDTLSGRQVLRLEGEIWTVLFGGKVCRIRDSRGVRHLAHLLQRPHQEVPALEIAGALGSLNAETLDPRASERARVNVTRALKGVLVRLEAHHLELFEHLRATIRTGAACSYRPDPRVPAVWACEFR